MQRISLHPVNQRNLFFRMQMSTERVLLEKRVTNFRQLPIQKPQSPVANLAKVWNWDQSRASSSISGIIYLAGQQNEICFLESAN